MEKMSQEIALDRSRTDSRRSARAPLILFSALAATGYVMSRFIADGSTYLFALHGLISSALLLIVIDWRGDYKTAGAHTLPILFAGGGLAFVPFLVLEGSRMVTPSLASILVISNALVIAAMVWSLGRKVFSRLQVVSLVTGFVGVVFLSLDLGATGGKTAGVIFLLAAAFIIAATTVAMEKTVHEIGGLSATKRMMMAAVPVGLGIQFITGGGVWFYSAEQSALGFLFGVASLGAPVLLFNIGMGMIGAADAANYKLLIPFFALLYGALIAGEAPSLEAALAGVITVVSVGIYQKSEKER